MRALAVLILLGALGLPAAAQTVAVLPAQSSLSYTGSALLHSWTGTSRQVSGTLGLSLGTPAATTIRLSVPVASFDSGNRTRDRTMREVTEAARFPTVTFVSRQVRADAWSGAPGARRGRWTVTGDLTFHGVTRPVTSVVTVREAGGRFVASGRFDVSLTAHGVERPAIGPSRVGDTLRLAFTITTPLPG
jgi:polyisoprenoid-binding protein YceI